ncbi:flagellar basal body L-ring protein FlgH [Erythrobacter aurantius]|uniref:flagellar basal body L-ring protein FlgH n=1 Tax=Erythrobacter aurantius TaxID=2909249 RepID=UPI00207A9102|nr:flagellar basal body L-ring protein FlgH [Erythrobacter aurantius]
MMKKTILPIAAALSLSACMGSGAQRELGFAAPPPPPAPAVVAGGNGASQGAIFQVSQGYSGLVTGTRARALGDMVTIRLVENTTTSKSTSSQTQRSGSFGITPPTAGPLDFLNPNALNASGEGSFNGGGTAAQQSQLSGTVAVTIAAIYPNGTAEVVGEKQMSLSQGDEWVQFAGRIRLVDIDADNTLPSSRVANARVIYSGKGQVQQASRPGWLSRFFNAVSPF